MDKVQKKESRNKSGIMLSINPESTVSTIIYAEYLQC